MGITDGPPVGERQAKHEAWSLEYNRKHHPNEMAAVRSGFSDAAHMCDAIAADVLRAGTRGTRVNKQAAIEAAALKRAGDAIWRVWTALATPPQPTPQPPNAPARGSEAGESVGASEVREKEGNG